ncbi:L-ribulose-5-phosphate 3-epimerase [Janthinobacterium sp. CG_23.3]|nr:L-ribulose-5-phosphate 3-epimerase [Janthinobacterium sp. CG_S6]
MVTQNSAMFDDSISFASGIAHQKYLRAEDGINVAFESGCTHWYLDASLIGEMVDDWTDERIDNLNTLIRKTRVQPIFHGNFKAPLASDVDVFRVAAVAYVKKEIDICAKIKAPLIAHGGCIVEPKMVVQAKKIALDNYLKSVTELAEYAADKGVDIYLENLSNYKNYRPFHYIFTNFDEYAYIFDNLKDNQNVFMFLDIGHENICDGNPVDVIRKHHHRIKGISFSNNNGVQDQHFGIGEGTLDYDAIIDEILKCGWRGLVAFETRSRSTAQSVADISEINQKLLEAVGN